MTVTCMQAVPVIGIGITPLLEVLLLWHSFLNVISIVFFRVLNFGQCLDLVWIWFELIEEKECFLEFHSIIVQNLFAPQEIMKTLPRCQFGSGAMDHKTHCSDHIMVLSHRSDHFSNQQQQQKNEERQI